MKERLELCKQCSGTEERPHYISGMGVICEECKIYQALGEYEKKKGKWVPFATYRNYESFPPKHKPVAI